MDAEIIAVGSELLLGQIANTNGQYLSHHLASLGINVYYHTVVGDNSARLKQSIELAQSRASLIIFTGGLGPTKDDLTKETVAEHIGKPLVYDEKALTFITDYYKKTGRLMTENNRKQALVIEGSTVLANDHGMAPGMVLKDPGTTYILLPGPPSEMKPMFTNYAKPMLMDSRRQIVSRVMRFFGIGESTLETEIIDLIDQQSNPTIAPLAKEGEVTLRLTASHENNETANQMIDKVEKIIMDRVGDYFYGYGETSLAEVAFQLLEKNHLTIASAESLTGGLFSEQITRFAGASSTFNGGIVCYTNPIKHNLLQVPNNVLEEEGAVSEACAKSLAENVRKKLNTDIGISFTGVAGPTESEGKEVGTVYIGFADDKQVTCFSLKLNGTRTGIRLRTAKHGFDLIRKYIISLQK